MSSLKLVLNFVTLLLCGAFLASLWYSLMTFHEAPTGTKVYQDNDRFEMPQSITVCGWINYKTPPNMTTFEDLEKLRRSRRYIVKAGFLSNNYYRPNSELTAIGFDDEEMMLKTFGMKQEDIWQDEIRLHILEPFEPFWCNTVNRPEDVESSYLMVLVLNMSHADSMIMEIAQYGKAAIYTDLSSDVLDIRRKTDGYQGSLHFASMRHVSLVNSCDAKNKLGDRKCFADFINTKMECFVPWLQNSTNSTGQICGSSKELEKYLKLRLEIHRGEFDQELEDSGCISKSLKNCESTSWPIGRDAAKVDTTLFGLMTHLFNWNDNDINIFDENIVVYGFIPEDKVEIFEEYFIYKFSNFVAEQGGYMGLFLGASFLSLIELILSVVVKVFKKSWWQEC